MKKRVIRLDRLGLGSPEADAAAAQRIDQEIRKRVDRQRQLISMAMLGVDGAAARTLIRPGEVVDRPDARELAQIFRLRDFMTQRTRGSKKFSRQRAEALRLAVEYRARHLTHRAATIARNILPDLAAFCGQSRVTCPQERALAAWIRSAPLS
jgi:hypothetical protein